MSPAMAKLFTLKEAEKLIPELQSLISEAISLKAEYAEAESDLQGTSRRIMMLGGAYVDQAQMLALKNRRAASMARLKEAIENIQNLGCLVKDLDTGLVDFPTLLRGAEVYLCWKLGEPSIQFWHRIEDGFRGRQKIDQDFLDNHAGDRPN